MDDYASHNKSVSKNVTSFCQSRDHADCAYSITNNLNVNDLGNHLTEFASIQEDQVSSHNAQPESNLLKNVGSGNTYDSHSTCLALEKCLVKLATFPSSDKGTSPNELVDKEEERKDDVAAEPVVHNGVVNFVDLTYSRLISLPGPLKPVSAMKKCEKRGIPPKKLSMTRVLDMYDHVPIDHVPMSVLHVPTNKPQCDRHDGKMNGKNGKNKQTNSGKSSQYSKGKDKEQAQKCEGSSLRGFCSLVNDIVVSSTELHTSIVDLDICSLDTFCGSSFLKKSVTKFHFPVEEAT